MTEPGVYDMPAADYFAHPALSCSGAKLLLPPSCPAKFKWAQTHPAEPKDVFDFGHVAHRLVLGKGAEIAVVEANDWRTKDAQTQKATARELGLTPILEDDYLRAAAMAKAVREDEVAGPLFTNGQAEASILWTDERTGVPLRARLDWLPDMCDDTTALLSDLVIPDLKTCRSADLDSISRALVTYSYMQQAAWYIDAVRSFSTAESVAFAFVFVEKDPPHLVTVAVPDATAIAAGRQLNERAIDLYAKCAADDHWPGHVDGVATVTLPAWAERAYLEETA